jgi:hypothetical protein
MDRLTQSYFENLHAEDKDKQYEAFNHIIAAINEKVDWSYEVWDQIKANLTHPDNHQRSRAAQFLCGLAKSDPEKRMLTDFPAVWEVTYDKKFVTARHTLQSLWKIGLAGKEQKEMVIKSLVDRFIKGVDEKNYTLIRFDMLQGMRNLYDAIKDEDLKRIALDLIEKVDDEKYKKKYAGVWRKA